MSLMLYTITVCSQQDRLLRLSPLPEPAWDLFGEKSSAFVEYLKILASMTQRSHIPRVFL